MITGIVIIGLLGGSPLLPRRHMSDTPDHINQKDRQSHVGTTVHGLSPSTPAARHPTRRRTVFRTGTYSPPPSDEPATTNPVALISDPYISEDLRGIEPGFNAASSFSASEQEFGVPAALLKALAYAETEMQHGDGSARPGGGHGIMNLRDADATTLADAAVLLQVDKAVLVRDPVQNIRGAAALLRKHYNDALEAGANDRPWYMALSYYTGKSPEDSVRFGENIRNLLREGFTHTTPAGEQVTLEPGQDYLLGK